MKNISKLLKTALIAVLVMLAVVAVAGCNKEIDDEELQDDSSYGISKKAEREVTAAVTEAFAKDENGEAAALNGLREAYIDGFFGENGNKEWCTKPAYENSKKEPLTAEQLLNELLLDEDLFNVVTEDCSVEEKKGSEDRFIATVFVKTVDFKKVFDEKINKEHGHQIIKEDSEKDVNCLSSSYGWDGIIVNMPFSEAVNNTLSGANALSKDDADQVAFTFLIDYVYKNNKNDSLSDTLFCKYPIEIEVVRVEAKDMDVKGKEKAQDEWKVVTESADIKQQLIDMFLYSDN